MQTDKSFDTDPYSASASQAPPEGNFYQESHGRPIRSFSTPALTSTVLAIVLWLGFPNLRAQVATPLAAATAGLCCEYFLCSVRPTRFFSPRLIVFIPVIIFFLLFEVHSLIVTIMWAWAAGCVVGAILGSKARNKRMNELRAAMLAPGWHVDGHSVSDSETAADRACAAIAQMNGKNRYLVSVTCDRARLDIAGRASTGLIVHYSPDPHSQNSWSLLLDRCRKRRRCTSKLAKPESERKLTDVRHSELNWVHYVIAAITPILAWTPITLSSGGDLAVPGLVTLVFGAATAFPLFAFLPRATAGWMFVVAILAETWLCGSIGSVWAAVGIEVIAGGAFGGALGVKLSEVLRHRRNKTRGIADPGSPGWHVQGFTLPSATEAKKRAYANIAELDGNRRHLVSIWNGYARLDVVGEANAGLVVYCSANSRSEDEWVLLQSQRSDEAEADVHIGPDILRLPQSNVVTASAAYRAVDGFLKHKAPDPDLNWLSGDQAFFRRPSLSF